MSNQEQANNATITLAYSGGVLATGKRVVVLSWNDDDTVSALVTEQHGGATEKEWHFTHGTMGLLAPDEAAKLASAVIRAIRATQQPPEQVSKIREQIRQGGLVFDYTKRE